MPALGDAAGTAEGLGRVATGGERRAWYNVWLLRAAGCCVGAVDAALVVSSKDGATIPDESARLSTTGATG